MLDIMIDMDIKLNYDKVELHEMVLLCTQFPGHRPKMSGEVRMLEGDGLEERLEASKNVETPKYKWMEIISNRYVDFIGEYSSLDLKAMELSGLR